jgi:hypothetical protein
VALTIGHRTEFVAALTNDLSFSDDAVPEDDVLAYVVEINRQSVILLDTPGLDYQDDDRGAAFGAISSWLRKKAR